MKKIKNLYEDLCYHLDCFMRSDLNDFIPELCQVLILLTMLILFSSCYITFMFTIYFIAGFWFASSALFEMILNVFDRDRKKD